MHIKIYNHMKKNEHILTCATGNLDTHKNKKCTRLSILKSLKLQRQNKGRAKDNGCYISGPVHTIKKMLISEINHSTFVDIYEGLHWLVGV